MALHHGAGLTMTKFLRKSVVVDMVGYSDQHLRRLEKAGRFPARVALGPGRVAWPEDEIRAWAAARLAERDSTKARSPRQGEA